VTGTVAIVNIPSPTNALRWLPGTLVQLGGKNAYTLRKRPTVFSGTFYLLEFVENAGSSGAVSVSIQEPILANQMVPFMWGPDASGTIFAVGDILRPGTLYFSKNYAPDSAPDSYNLELTPPTEPLLGGEEIDGLSFVGSSERWWALYPQPDNPTQRYNPVKQPFSRGLAAPYGHCNDGTTLYWWAKDGIWSSKDGSLTDADLYNLFPHEGVAGVAVTYSTVTIQPPNYAIVGSFRLTYSNGYLYAVYLDAQLNYRVLVYDIRRKAWSADSYSPPVTCFYHPEQAAGGATALEVQRNDELLMGNTAGQVATQVELTNDLANTIFCTLATFEFDAGDLRAGKEWGDVWLDSIPAAKAAALNLAPMSLGVNIAPTPSIPQGTARLQAPVSVGGHVLADYFGCAFQWTDDFTQQPTQTKLISWQPSFIPKPETITDRFTDWDDAGVGESKWWQGFTLHADTFNQLKGLQVRDAETQALHPFTPTMRHNGESEITYSFNTPFIAHMVRIEPTDQLPWRLWDVRWVTEPTPSTAETWQTQASTHGLLGFMHVRQLSITYASTVPVTLTIGVFDGTAPAPITLPSTGGAVQKIVVVPTFNKGQLFTYKFTGSSPFQVYQDKCEVLVGQWGRPDSYVNRPLVGSRGGDEAKV
jgi:hypothetical protein